LRILRFILSDLSACFIVDLLACFFVKYVHTMHLGLVFLLLLLFGLVCFQTFVLVLLKYPAIIEAIVETKTFANV